MNRADGARMDAQASGRPETTATDPANADNLYALGRRKKEANDNAGAEDSYRAALSARPDFADAWISLGILLRRLGRHGEAEECQRQALRIDTGNSLAHLNLGNALLAQQRTDEAADAYLAALQVNPRCAEAHNNLGQLLLRQKNRAEAARHFAAALATDPRYFEAATGLGEILVDEGQAQAAIGPLEIANQSRPDDLAVKVMLGRAYGGIGQYSRAATEFEAVLQAQPGRRDATYGLATSLAYAGQYTKPRAMLEPLVAGDGCDDYCRFAYATLLLRAGEFREGWRHYDARRAFETVNARNFPERRWQGESLSGKNLLVVREQGLGDEVMFASLLPELVESAQHCIVECDQRLANLYRRSFPGATVFAVALRDPDCDQKLELNRASLPPFDYWALLGDLPRHRRNDAAEFPPHRGYLSADAERTQAWRERLTRHFGTGLKVGIGWRGGVAQTRAAERSVSLEQLKPILAIPNVHFVSLQHGAHAQELAQFRGSSGMTIEHWQETIDDLDEYAALISALDLVVSVCSAVVHMGGALGRPTWVLAPLVPEWRYGREGDSMIWYPSVRVFRQDKKRDWKPVVAAIKRELRKAQSDSRSLQDRA